LTKASVIGVTLQARRRRGERHGFRHGDNGLTSTERNQGFDGSVSILEFLAQTAQALFPRPDNLPQADSFARKLGTDGST
jgi:hypothetical protein